MTHHAANVSRQRPDVEWLHWLFVRDHHAISCDVDVGATGLYTISVMPLWTTEGRITETYASADEAMRRHGQIARGLRASGWLLAECAIVKPAA